METLNIVTTGNHVAGVTTKGSLMATFPSGPTTYMVINCNTERNYTLNGITWKTVVFKCCKIGGDIVVMDGNITDILIDEFTLNNLGGRIYSQDGRKLSVTPQ